MNNDRIQEILDLMEEARLDYFLISDPQSIAYCTGYYNDPHTLKNRRTILFFY